MLKHLLIILDSAKINWCHFRFSGDAECIESKTIIEPEILKQAIIFALKHNLSIQVISSQESISTNIKTILESVPYFCYSPENASDCMIKNNIEVATDDPENIMICCNLQELERGKGNLTNGISHSKRINLFLNDISSYKEEEYIKLYDILCEISRSIESEYIEGRYPQLNIITDRFYLDKHNLCDAGDGSIAISPEGYFYICPAFYYDGADNLGHITSGFSIPNHYLLMRENQIVCKNCTAFHCNACKWLSKKSTGEFNVPSHEQCVIAHIEQKVSFNLKERIKNKIKITGWMSEFSEPSIYDPFEIIKRV